MIDPKVLIPMIRKAVPTTIAHQIVGVGPLLPKRLMYEVLDEGWEKVTPEGHKSIMTNVEIAHWIEQQPIHMWKYIDLETKGETYQLNTHFIVSDELLSWLILRWS
jgi:hypothetical protein